MTEALGNEDDIKRLADQLEADAEWLREDHPGVVHDMGASLETAAATIRSLCKQLDEARRGCAEPGCTKPTVSPAQAWCKEHDRKGGLPYA